MTFKRVLVEAIRLPECAFVVFLGYISFRHVSIPVDMQILVALAFITGATMLQNGWRDRRHDLVKGKDLALKRPIPYLILLVIFWILSVGAITMVSVEESVAALMLAGIAFVGVLYSEVRRIPLLSITLVTLTVGSATLIPVALGADFGELSLLFFATTLLMFGRENLHDIADQKADIDYKKTIPLVLGDTLARIASAIALVFGSVVAYFITPFSVVGSAFIFFGLTKIKSDPVVTVVRKWSDIGLVLLAVSLLVNFVI